MASSRAPATSAHVGPSPLTTILPRQPSCSTRIGRTLTRLVRALMNTCSAVWAAASGSAPRHTVGVQAGPLKANRSPLGLRYA